MKQPWIRLRILMVMVAGFAGLLAWILREDRVLDSHDCIAVDVRTALPGRPISGGRLVRHDGTTSLGYYGNVPVAGLTPREAKSRIVNHLRPFLSDEDLGLAKAVTLSDGRRSIQRVSSYRTECVSVRIVAKNAPSLVERFVQSVDRTFGSRFGRRWAQARRDHRRAAREMTLR